MRVYDYHCTACGATHEHYVRNDKVTEVQCKSCGLNGAKRGVSAPLFKLEGVTGDFPTALQKWEQRHTPKR